MIMDCAKNGRWINPFKKFGMVRVKMLLCTIFIENEKAVQYNCYAFLLPVIMSKNKSMTAAKTK